MQKQRERKRGGERESPLEGKCSQERMQRLRQRGRKRRREIANRKHRLMRIRK